MGTFDREYMKRKLEERAVDGVDPLLSRVPERPENVTIAHCRELLDSSTAVVRAVVTVVSVMGRSADGPVLVKSSGWLMVASDGEMESLGARMADAGWPWITHRVGRDPERRCTYFVLGEDRLERQWAGEKC